MHKGEKDVGNVWARWAIHEDTKPGPTFRTGDRDQKTADAVVADVQAHA